LLSKELYHATAKQDYSNSKCEYLKLAYRFIFIIFLCLSLNLNLNASAPDSSNQQSVAEKPFRVYLNGVWDLFHRGHKNFMKKALDKGKEYSDGKEVQLVIGVVDDELLAGYKRVSIMTVDERVQSVKAYAKDYEVIRNVPLKITQEFINRHDVNLIVHGDDFNNKKATTYFGDALSKGIYAQVSYTEGISTTQLIDEVMREGRFISDSLKDLPVEESKLIQRILTLNCDK